MSHILRQIPGFRSGVRWKQVLAVFGYLTVLSIGLSGGFAGLVFAALTLLTVAVWGNVSGLRSRLPGFGSPSRGTQMASWSLLVGAAALSGAMALRGSGEPAAGPPGGEAVTRQELTGQPVTEEALTAPTAAATAILDRPTAKPTSPPPATATAVPPTDTPEPTPVPPTEAPPVDLDPYVDRRCDEFDNYDQMLAWRRYWQRRGISNPGRLDGDGDGLACEDGEGGRPAATSAPMPLAQPVAPSPAIPPCRGYRPCDHFATHEQAQRYFESCGRPSKMDRDGDGVACESLP